jgi:hypothetical protein
VIDAKVHAETHAAPILPQSNAATMHRQPTQRSISDAEIGVGLISPNVAKAVRAAMMRALEADRAGDRNECEEALTQVERLLNSAATQLAPDGR